MYFSKMYPTTSGVDFVANSQWSIVKVPGEVIKEVEEPLECFVGDFNFSVALFQLVWFEETTIEIRDVAEQFFKITIELSIVLVFAKTVMEELDQEVVVERLKLILPFCFTYSLHAISQVVDVAVEEPFLLDEVDEHQPIEHQ